MGIKVELAKLAAQTDVAISDPAGQPDLEKVDVPADLREFYELCGGVTFYAGTPYELRILAPGEVKPSNPIVAHETTQTGDRSDDWYVIANSSNDDYLIIDLGEGREGRIYDGYYEVYGFVGDMSMIARSFADLLERLRTHPAPDGTYYWMTEGWEPLGDAYD